MRLEPLELFVRVKIGIFVVETDHHTHMNQIGLHMVKESACISARLDRPTHSVLHIARFKQWVFFIDLPHLLQTDTVELGIAVFLQIEFLNDSFSKRPPSSLSKDSLFCDYFDAWCKIVLLLSLF